MASPRIAGAPSSSPTIPPSPRSSTTSSGSTSARRRMPWCSASTRKVQIQALDRTQPGLPMKKGRGATMTHDYKRHGTTTLFAALNVLDGTVFGQNMQRHRHQEFIRFLNALERDIPAGKLVHAILDNYAAHKTPEVRALAGPSSALDLPLHADLELLAERRRGLLRQALQASPEARRLPLRRRPPGRHQPLRRRAQPEPQALRLARRSRRHHRRPQQRVPSVGVNPTSYGQHANSQTPHSLLNPESSSFDLSFVPALFTRPLVPHGGLIGLGKGFSTTQVNRIGATPQARSPLLQNHRKWSKFTSPAPRRAVFVTSSIGAMPSTSAACRSRRNRPKPAPSARDRRRGGS